MQVFALLTLPMLAAPVLAACVQDQAPTPVEESLVLIDAFPEQRFDDPLFMTYPDDDTDRLFVTEKTGRILYFHAKKPSEPAIEFLDLRDKVTAKAWEDGLLGFAFDPKFKDNGYFYVHYSSKQDKKVGYVSRFQVSEDDPTQADPNSEFVILRQPQPWRNHNGGMIGFGPDGYLYISFGDGGAGGDPKNSGQDRSTWLGAILRIDVSQSTEEAPYSVPKDNPFVDEEGVAPEIWAYGLRNVWRFSFDRETGELWAGDVGQNRWEEIDIITKGGNYGWNRYEGFENFERKKPLERDQHIDPVAVYGRQEGISVTGGYVYRGSMYPDLVGSYLYGDFAYGNLWRLTRNADGSLKNVIALEKGHRPINSFAEDRAGEVYLVSGRGKLLRVGLAGDQEDE